MIYFSPLPAIALTAYNSGSLTQWVEMMAKHRNGKANQKCYFAGFYLEAIEKAEKDESLLNRKAVLAAHRESCLFHLMGAYEALIWEVAQTYDEVFRVGDSLQSLLESVQLRDKNIPELEHLATLQSRAGSWLNQMVSQWHRIQDLDPTATTVAKAPVNLNAIEVRVSMDKDELVQLPDWHENLRNLIDEIRQTLGEW